MCLSPLAYKNDGSSFFIPSNMHFFGGYPLNIRYVRSVFDIPKIIDRVFDEHDMWRTISMISEYLKRIFSQYEMCLCIFCKYPAKILIKRSENITEWNISRESVYSVIKSHFLYIGNSETGIMAEHDFQRL